jgi:hypothetical protein
MRFLLGNVFSIKLYIYIQLLTLSFGPAQAHGLDIEKCLVSKQIVVQSSDSSDIKLLDFWKELQKAETLLVQTSIKYNKEQSGEIFANVTLERPLLILLIRTSSVLNIKGFTANDYLIRYPFSSTELITVELEKLVAQGFISKRDNSSIYLISKTGLEVVNHYIQERGNIMDLLDLGQLKTEEINELLEIDHRIVNAISLGASKENNPILYNRLSGLQPNYTPRKLWHHWQLVYTIMAFQDDAIEHVRKSKGLDPLTWSIRRNVWFVEKRPWLAKSVTFEGLVGGSQNYAPQEDPETKIAESIDALKKVGWLIEEDNEYHLTKEGLIAQDKDQELIMKLFFSKWPEISKLEMNRVYQSVKMLNNHLEELGELIE